MHWLTCLYLGIFQGAACVKAVRGARRAPIQVTSLLPSLYLPVTTEITEHPSHPPRVHSIRSTLLVCTESNYRDSHRTIRSVVVWLGLSALTKASIVVSIDSRCPPAARGRFSCDVIPAVSVRFITSENLSTTVQ